MISGMRLLGRNLVHKRHIMKAIIYGIDIGGKSSMRHQCDLTLHPSGSESQALTAAMQEASRKWRGFQTISL
jgi:hypothetical protein